MKLYGSSSVENLINAYVERDGEIHEIEEGSLGYGLLIMTGEGLKTTVVQEVYLNAQSSGHKIRKYNKIPLKYEEMLERLYALK